MELQITKKNLLDYFNGNEYCDAFKYWIVYGRIINDAKTRFRKFKFCIKIYKDDLFEYDGYPEKMSLARQREITDEFIASFIDDNRPKSYNDCGAFFNECNETIKQYNKYIA